MRVECFFLEGSSIVSGLDLSFGKRRCSSVVFRCKLSRLLECSLLVCGMEWRADGEDGEEEEKARIKKRQKHNK